MPNIFISGATGFIGSHLAQKLAADNNVITIIRDIPNTSSPWGKWVFEVLSHINMIHGNLLNPCLVKRVLSENNIDQVCHVAAQAIVAVSQKDPSTTYKTNVQGTVNLLEACRQLDIPNIYLISTDKVYGDKMDAKETDPLVASGIYETSKTCQDLTAQAYAKTYGLKIIIGRACNTYGFDNAKRIIPNTIRQCLKNEQPTIYENENSLRQYMYVKDHVSAIIYLLSCNHDTYPAIYNIGTGDILTQEEVVNGIANVFGLTPKTIKREKTLKEIQSQSVNFTKIIRAGWCPRYNFINGIKETKQKFEEYEHV